MGTHLIRLSIWHHYCFTAVLSVKGTDWSAHTSAALVPRESRSGNENSPSYWYGTTLYSASSTQLCSSMSVQCNDHKYPTPNLVTPLFLMFIFSAAFTKWTVQLVTPQCVSVLLVTGALHLDHNLAWLLVSSVNILQLHHTVKVLK